MTPQERELITTLLERLKGIGAQPKDPEADQLIRQAVAAQPDMPYYLVQTALIQDLSLHQAQNRIAELEKQVTEVQSKPTSFLGSLFGTSQPATPPAPAPAATGGPWSRSYQQGASAPPPPPPGGGYAQPGYAQPQGGYAPAGGGFMGGGMGAMGGGGGFLRSAAATAAGVAGGALLFQGIQSLFGGHGGLGGGFGPAGFGGGFVQQPGITETVVNNYYDTPNPGGDQSFVDSTGFDSSPDVTNVGFDDSGSDFGGGGDDDFV
jgi:hypothetical protein